ncbi:hypothetical protein CVT25_005592 [Psilocybe cyanescens]|uniref:Uncharacterized protein n=1 Tax=Psilocybe cyanescens TaxID=93625 RepID=A0A409WA37_PSICY|nr:hypothetical protein CVT25_005592 [Psilocybe cyanescens]
MALYPDLKSSENGVQPQEFGTESLSQSSSLLTISIQAEYCFSPEQHISPAEADRNAVERNQSHSVDEQDDSNVDPRLITIPHVSHHPIYPIPNLPAPKNDISVYIPFLCPASNPLKTPAIKKPNAKTLTLIQSQDAIINGVTAAHQLNKSYQAKSTQPDVNEDTTATNAKQVIAVSGGWA